MKLQYRVNWKPQKLHFQKETIEQSQRAALQVVSELVKAGYIPITITVEPHNGRTDGL